MQHVHALARNISGLMDGSCNPDPAKFGLTSDDELINSSAPNVRLSSATTPFAIYMEAVYPFTARRGGYAGRMD